MTAYDADILLWSERQAELLRRRAAGALVNDAELDWPNIAEEIEDLGKSLEREVGSRIATILIHLMKLEASPARDPRIGWLETIRAQRDELERVLEQAPKLRGMVAAFIGGELARARRRVGASLADHDEQPRIDLDQLVYGEDQVLGPWLPG